LCARGRWLGAGGDQEPEAAPEELALRPLSPAQKEPAGRDCSLPAGDYDCLTAVT